MQLADGELRFTAPGDDGGCGAAARYEIVTSSAPIEPSGFDSATPLEVPPTPGPAGTAETFALPSHARYLAVRAVDEVGNVGWPAQLDTGSGHGGEGPRPGGSPIGGGPSGVPAPGGAASSSPARPAPTTRARKCRKGLRRKKVRGKKVRCVKKAKKRHRRRAAAR